MTKASSHKLLKWHDEYVEMHLWISTNIEGTAAYIRTIEFNLKHVVLFWDVPIISYSGLVWKI